MKNGKDVAVEEKPQEQSLTIGKVFSLTPTNLDQAIKLAELIAGSDLAPKDFKGKSGNCLIAMQMGMEVGLAPMQAIQNIAVINGKPSVYGDVGKALLFSKGFKIDERDTKETKAKGEAWCKVTRPDGEFAERTFSLEDAKTAGLWGKQGPWTTNPYRQMAWRAFWFAARDKAADVLKGICGAEEVEDYVETTSEPAAPIAMPKPMVPEDSAPAYDGNAVLLPGEYSFFFKQMAKLGADMDEVQRFAKDKFGTADLTKLTKDQAKQVIFTWNPEPPEQAA